MLKKAPKISLCQHIPVKGQDMEENFRLASELVKQAASEGADLAVLPEYSLAVPHNEHDNWADKEYFYLRKYQDLARSLEINLVPGTIGEWEVLEKGGEPVLSNNAYFIGRDGTVLGTYRKKNLWHPEREFFVKGTDEHAIFDTEEFGRVGLLICWDLCFPEAFRSLLRLGVQTIVAPTCWTYADAGKGIKYNALSERVFLESLLVLRAFENEVVLVFCNIGAEDDDQELGGVGISQITAPFLGKVAGFDHARRGVITAEIDYSCLEVAEQVYKIRKDVMNEDWHY